MHKERDGVFRLFPFGTTQWLFIFLLFSIFLCLLFFPQLLQFLFLPSYSASFTNSIIGSIISNPSLFGTTYHYPFFPRLKQKKRPVYKTNGYQEQKCVP